MTSPKENAAAEKIDSSLPAKQSNGHRSAPARLAAYLVRQIPTVLVLVALLGVAYWGHRTGWKAPSFAQLTGASQQAPKEDWCDEHGVPDSICIACHPELGGGNPADWCKEHGVPESKCTVCHPEILTKGVAGDWCKEHGVPESGCTYCHPEIAVRGQMPPLETAITVLPAVGATQPANSAQVEPTKPPSIEFAEVPATQPGKDPKTCQTHARRVQFASAEAVLKAGLKFAVAEEKPIAAMLRVNAETNYDRTRLAQLSSPVSGKVWRVEKEVGQRVAKGEVMALLDSADVGRAKSELLQAAVSLDGSTKALKRVKASAEAGLKTDAELQEAESRHSAAMVTTFNAQQALINLGLPIRKEDLGQDVTAQRVRFLGLPESLVKTLDPETTTANLIPVVAPFDGVVISREVVAGEVVESHKMLFTIADTSRMWVTMDVSSHDALRIRRGQEVTFQPDEARDEGVRGAVSWISTEVSDETRTVHVRADVPNPDQHLLAKTFGQAQIVIRRTPKAVVIPNEAVQWEGCCYIAFVRLSDTVFQTRKLRIGARANGFTEVIIGVLPGEVVATAGSYVLKSEIFKSNLGAGCTDD